MCKDIIHQLCEEKTKQNKRKFYQSEIMYLFVCVYMLCLLNGMYHLLFSHTDLTTAALVGGWQCTVALARD